MCSGAALLKAAGPLVAYVIRLVSRIRTTPDRPEFAKYLIFKDFPEFGFSSVKSHQHSTPLRDAQKALSFNHLGLFSCPGSAQRTGSRSNLNASGSQCSSRRPCAPPCSCGSSTTSVIVPMISLPQNPGLLNQQATWCGPAPMLALRVSLLRQPTELCTEKPNNCHQVDLAAT